MDSWKKVLAALLLLATLSPIKGQTAEELREWAKQSLEPLRVEKYTGRQPSELVELGRMLFFEPRVSVDGTVSCSRCHLPQLYGTDGLPRSIGAGGKANPRNSPTVLNSALQFSQHWRGDRESLEDQAMRALVGPTSFGNPTMEDAMKRLEAIEAYRDIFRKVFPHDKEPISPRNWAAAIGAFERQLLTRSPFDAWMEGSDEALSSREKRGLQRFLELGCVDCHSGVGLGGQSYEKFGIHEDYWKLTKSKEVDMGRWDVTGNPDDRFVFKVPVLRNVAMTPPYFHDGSVGKLSEAVEIMAKAQLGLELSREDLDSLMAFLESLTGEIPKAFQRAPSLPPRGFAGR